MSKDKEQQQDHVWDAGVQNEPATVEQSVEQFKCAACGNELNFDPKSGKMLCAHCGTAQDIDVSRDVRETPVDFRLDKEMKWASETRTFHCENCGATMSFDKAEFSTECAYCGSNKVLSMDNFDGIKPHALLPFVLTQDEAVAANIKWLKKRLYAPRKMKKEVIPSHMKGVYSPCWTFNSSTFSSYRGVAGTYYYVTVGSGKNRRTERRVRWFPVSGRYNRAFKNVAIEASPHLQQKDFQKLSPFPFTNAVEYDKRFLSGFAADHYDRNLKEGWGEAEKMMRSQIRSDIERSIRADVIRELTVNTNFNDNTFKHVLLPVYVGRASFKEKVYNFFINGINGKVTGKTPVSVPKVLITVGIGLIAVAAIALLVYFMGGV